LVWLKGKYDTLRFAGVDFTRRGLSAEVSYSPELIIYRKYGTVVRDGTQRVHPLVQGA